jgi:hypothetical protein
MPVLLEASGLSEGSEGTVTFCLLGRAGTRVCASVYVCTRAADLAQVTVGLIQSRGRVFCGPHLTPLHLTLSALCLDAADLIHLHCNFFYNLRLKLSFLFSWVNPIFCRKPKPVKGWE